VREEAGYLLEWIAYHRVLGVKIFLLADNGGSDSPGRGWGSSPTNRRRSFTADINDCLQLTHGHPFCLDGSFTPEKQTLASTTCTSASGL